MPASPLTDDQWPGLPLLQCDMDEGTYRLFVDEPVLIVRNDTGSIVEVADDDGSCVRFRQAPLRFDLFSSGKEMLAVTDRPATKSLVVALPLHWLGAVGEALDEENLRSCFQFGDRELWRLVWRLNTHHRQGAPLGAAYSVAVSRRIVDRLVALQLAAQQQRTQSSSLDGEARGLVERLVDANLQEPLSVAALASSIGMSVVQFMREFKAAWGATPHQYLQQRRLARAKLLLTSTDASVAQIALEVGYANHAHFSTAFRVSMGMTPSAFRRCND